MKWFLIKGLFFCFILTALFSCKNEFSDIPKNALFSEQIKSLHYQKEQANIANILSNDSCLNAAIAKVINEQNQSMLNDFNLLADDNCPICNEDPVVKWLCCKTNGPPSSCPGERVCPVVIKTDRFAGLVAPVEIDELVITDEKKDIVGQIDKKNIRKLRSGLLFYPIIWKVSSLPNSYTIEMSQTVAGVRKKYDVNGMQ